MHFAAIGRALAVLLVFNLSHLGCEKGSSSSSTRGDPRDPVVPFADEDADMNGAIQQARTSVDQFITALQKPAPTQSYFSVKKPFPTRRGGDEHIWLDNLQFDGSTFVGNVSNIPADVPGLKEGDRASVGKHEISDWMIVADDGKLTGGYTIRVIRDRMSPAERADFDQQTGFQYD